MLATPGCTNEPPSPEPTRPTAPIASPTAPVASPTADPASTGPTSPGVQPPLDPEHVADARADLVDRFGYDPATIEVERIEDVTWRDGALGCPHHERTYDPASVDGYRLVLRVGEQEFQYHGADGEPPFLCEFLDA